MKGFIIFRDRVTYAHLCLTALIEAGVEPVVVDHGSTWPLAEDWLLAIEAAEVTVLRRGPGCHPRSLWEWDTFRELCGDQKYLVTDPDVVPSDDCPADWVNWLSTLLDRRPEISKAALGLRLDNIPDSYQNKNHVLEWERQFWVNMTADGVCETVVDTTMAVYRPLTEQPSFAMSALRTGPPYLADHLAWHEDLHNLDPELAWYHEHAERGISYWTTPERSAWNAP